MIATYHQRRIALDTLKLHKLGARIMGGMDHREAVKFLRSDGMSDLDIRTRLKAAGHSDEEADEFMKS